MMSLDLFWIISWIALCLLLEEREVVYGMPTLAGGSENCRLTLRPFEAEENTTHVAFLIVYNDETPFSANSGDCELLWTDHRKRKNAEGNEAVMLRSTVHLIGESSMITFEKKFTWQLTLRTDSELWLSCSNRKFSCVSFWHNGDVFGSDVSTSIRKLLSVEHLSLDQGLSSGVFVNPVLLAVVGFCILVVAVGLCANCNKDDESLSQPPHLLSVEKRQSKREGGEEVEVGEAVQVALELKDAAVAESGKRERTDIVDATVRVAPITVTEETAVRPQSSKEGDQQPEHGVNRARADDSDWAKSESEQTEHEENKGKFWKRTRSSKCSTSSTVSGHRTSDVVFREEGHKDKRSRKESKEGKSKTGKGKGKKNEEGEKSQTKPSDGSKDQTNDILRPREATPSLERHAREFPLFLGAPGGPSAPALPDRPRPVRQSSLPNELADNDYEEVATRRTKSVEDATDSYLQTDDLYDAVREDVVHLRPSSANYEIVSKDGTGSRPVSDIYELVEEPGAVFDELYSTVDEAENKNTRTKGIPLGVDESDLYQEVEENQTVEDPYSKVKKRKKVKSCEASDLYEEVDKKNENSAFSYEYAVVQKKKDRRALVVKETDSVRVRARSGGTEMKRVNTEEAKRPNSIHIMHTSKESNTELDYLYAKVDRSKKRKSRLAGEKRSTEPHSNDDDDDEGEGGGTPPPLPPPYVSSRQIKIEMGLMEETPDVVAENLYDEVNPSLGLNSEILVSHVSTSKRNTSDHEPANKVNSKRVASAQNISARTQVVVEGTNGDIKHEEDDEKVPRYETVMPRLSRAVKEPIERTSKNSRKYTDPEWV